MNMYHPEWFEEGRKELGSYLRAIENTKKLLKKNDDGTYCFERNITQDEYDALMEIFSLCDKRICDELFDMRLAENRLRRI